MDGKTLLLGLVSGGLLGLLWASGGSGGSVAWGAASGGETPSAVVANGPDGTQVVYLWDTAERTLSVYQYDPRRSKLKLGAARNVGADQRLLEFNNEEPHVSDIEKLARSK